MHFMQERHLAAIKQLDQTVKQGSSRQSPHPMDSPQHYRQWPVSRLAAAWKPGIIWMPLLPN